MTDNPFLPGLALVVAVAAAVFAFLLALGVSRLGPGRGGLASGGLPLALLPAVVATAYVSWKLVGLFAGMAESGATSLATLLDALRSLWLIERVAWGAVAATCALGFLLGLVRSAPQTDDAPCSPRRGLVLVLLPVLGLLVAGALTREAAKAMRVTAAVVSSDEHDPASQSRGDAVLEAAGLPTKGSGSLGTVSRFLARATMVGAFGGAIASVILLGLALPGSILAWRVRFGGAFLAVASVLWLLGAAGGSLVALGILDPLKLP